MRGLNWSLLFLLFLPFTLWAQDHNHDGHKHSDGTHHEAHDDHGHDHAHHEPGPCGQVHKKFDPGATAFHHIADQNVYSIGPWQLPLPCILYTSGQGFDFFSSGKFHADAHGIGEHAYNGFALYNGVVRRVVDPGFPMEGSVDLGHHAVFSVEEEVDGKKKDIIYVCYKDKRYKCDSKSTADAGLFGGGITSFFDFSLTKNVVSMLIVVAFLSWIFLAMAKRYRTSPDSAPTGITNFMEPMFIFIQDEVAKPFIGDKWEKFLPFLQAVFFFILGLNLFGQVPFFGGSNVTGNLAVTMVLGILAFFVTNLNGNKNYWEHTLWMPGVPPALKVIILTPVEILGLFIKPLTLMLRLFANITAGHMVVVIFVSLIFVFGDSGHNVGASYGTAIGSTLLTLFMMAIELVVAFIQAFVFTILTGSYIGAAVEEAHH